MVVEVTLFADVDVPPSMDENSVASLVEFMLVAEGHDGDFEMGVQFVDDHTMQAAHLEFMDIDEPTDIMTFPYEDDGDPEFASGESMGTAGGDLLISVERAEENAAAAGWSTADELLFLIAHGTLHLLGWDDHADADRAHMLARQQELIQNWRGASSL